MEATTDGAVPSQNRDDLIIAKGRRTKRQRRPHSPLSRNHHLPPRSPATSYATSSDSEESTTTEEADTARCLILLSRGHFPANPNYNNNPRCNEAATTSYGGGACMYTCKTCNRSFSSFQALGGHRASHKRPKNEKKPAFFSDEEEFPSSKNKFSSPNSLSLQLSCTTSATMKSSPSPRIHECSYCGAEFSSGQALGGHMRKHRGAAPVNRLLKIPAAINDDDEIELQETNVMAGNWLSLDLNLPAPDLHERIGPCPPLPLRH